MHARNKFLKIFKIMCLIFLSTIFSIFFVEFISFSLIKLGVKNLSLSSQESNTTPQNTNSLLEHATSIEKLIITNKGPSQDNIDSSGFKNFFNNSIQVDGLNFPQKHTTIIGLLKNNKSFHKHFVMIGCSFVFGVGLDDQSTMPWLMQEKMPDYKLYNLPFVGYGPNSILARALNYDFFPT